MRLPLFRGLRVHRDGAEQFVVQLHKQVHHGGLPLHVHHGDGSDVTEQSLALLLPGAPWPEVAPSAPSAMARTLGAQASAPPLLPRGLLRLQ